MPALKRLHMPANEQTSRPGSDGTVETDVGTEFVPFGASIWEMVVKNHPWQHPSRDCAEPFEWVH